MWLGMGEQDNLIGRQYDAVDRPLFGESSNKVSKRKEQSSLCVIAHI